MAIIAPSILASDWTKLADEISSVEAAGADWIHLDVMDGQFVPPITFGPQLVKAAREITDLPLDVHLMIVQPEKQIKAFRDAGADCITVHAEACPHLHRTLQEIKESGAEAGVAINPGTPVASIEPVLDTIDLLLVMSVNPGWGGQSFIHHSISKLQEARDLIEHSGHDIYLEVDGGINESTAQEVVAAGATVLVAGSYIFQSSDYTKAIHSLRTNP